MAKAKDHYEKSSIFDDNSCFDILILVLTH